MQEIRYIYFEVIQIGGAKLSEQKIDNENALLFKPHTNSSGIWSHRYTIEQRRFSGSTILLIDQYWIDLEKFKKEKHKVYQKLKKQVDIVLKKLNKKLIKHE